jgi:dolichyl-phosphate-mannose--protein O-mannosyl transferase
MEHPFMSQWWEWPTMDASTVPFAATHEGGQLKALGNPAVWWGVTANFLAATPLWALVYLRLREWGGLRARFPRSAAALDPLLIPFATLYAGYLLNLVPYQLITRSKFVYHYIPALMQGVLLFATCVEALVRFGGVVGGGGAPGRWGSAAGAVWRGAGGVPLLGAALWVWVQDQRQAARGAHV